MAYKKLDPKFKAKWVKALRSGRYKQTDNTLREINSKGESRYCCLGVACNIIDRKAWRTDFAFADDYHLAWGKYPSNETRHLKFVTSAVGSKHSQMNDSGSTFKDIADWIDKNL